jgi:NDP-sugar pyrophosphorylase family protein
MSGKTPGVQCLILAGGLATRMRPLTEKIPKALIEAEGRPFAHYQLDWLAKHGVTDVVFSIGYLGGMIRDYVGDGSAWGLRVRYVDEGAELRGTGGAVRLAVDQGVLEPSFLVTYGDAFLPVDFLDFDRAFRATDKPAQMSIYRNAGKGDTSNVLFEGGRVVLYDKDRGNPHFARMRHIDYGLLAFRRNIIEERIPRGEKHDLSVLLRDLSREGALAHYEVSERFYEIGSVSGLEDFKELLRRTRAPGDAGPR